MLNVTTAAEVSPVSTRRLVRCEVIVISPEDDSLESDLLPWADPYIASLEAALRREEESVA